MKLFQSLIPSFAGNGTAGRMVTAREVCMQLFFPPKSASNEAKQVLDAINKKVLLLKAESEEIKSITEIIKDISERSKLLSLNASIEAARSGENGNGFGLAAQGVKELANQSTKAFCLINYVFNRIQGKIENVVKTIDAECEIFKIQNGAVKRACQPFSYISSHMQEFIDHMNNLTNCISEIHVLRDYTVKSIGNIVEFAERTADSIDDLTAESDEQIAISEQLSELPKYIARGLSVKISQYVY